MAAVVNEWRLWIQGGRKAFGEGGGCTCVCRRWGLMEWPAAAHHLPLVARRILQVNRSLLWQPLNLF